MTSLHVKYRPRAFKEVVGQTAAVRALSSSLQRHEAHSYLLTGPSGVGKTTLARIAADTLGCDPAGLMEIDAATYTGIDAMREVQNITRHLPFGKSPLRMVIVDECHGLTRQAWQSILKSLEEPPEHVYWFLCTTEPDKVPETVKTRCVHIMVSAVANAALQTLLDKVINAERMKLADDIRTVIIREAHGSPRQMLVNLEVCRDAANVTEAKQLLHSAGKTDAVLELCRFLAAPQTGSWLKATAIIRKLEENGTSAESTRIVVCNYIAKALINDTGDKVDHLLGVLSMFSNQYNQSEGVAPLLLSVGAILRGQPDEE